MMTQSLMTQPSYSTTEPLQAVRAVLRRVAGLRHPVLRHQAAVHHQAVRARVPRNHPHRVARAQFLRAQAVQAQASPVHRQAARLQAFRALRRRVAQAQVNLRHQAAAQAQACRVARVLPQVSRRLAAALLNRVDGIYSLSKQIIPASQKTHLLQSPQPLGPSKMNKPTSLELPAPRRIQIHPLRGARGMNKPMNRGSCTNAFIV